MERISEFIQSFNNILNKALSPEDVFKIELSYMLQAPDYDAFITLYDIALNEKIRIYLIVLLKNFNMIVLILSKLTTSTIFLKSNLNLYVYSGKIMQII